MNNSRVHNRICLCCREVKPMTDGMQMCDDCREKVCIKIFPTGGGDVSKAEKPKLLDLLVNADYFENQSQVRDNPFYEDLIPEVVKDYLETLDSKQVADKLEVHENTINSILIGENIRLWAKDLQTTVRKEHLAGMSKEEIGEKYHLSETAVTTLLDKTIRIRLARDLEKIQNDEMQRLYFHDDCTQYEIADIYSCSLPKVVQVCGKIRPKDAVRGWKPDIE